MDKENLNPNTSFSSRNQNEGCSRTVKKSKRRPEEDPIWFAGNSREEAPLNQEDKISGSGNKGHPMANFWGGRSFSEALKAKHDEEPSYEGSDDEGDEAAADYQGLKALTGSQHLNLSKFPSIVTSKDDWQRMVKPWRKSLIFKVLGKTMGFKFLEQRLKGMWGLKKGFELTDLDQGFFIIRFRDKEDYLRVLDGGPWVIQGHYVIVRKWSPDFRPSEEDVSTTLIWLRLPGLPIQYYNEFFLLKVGNALGKAVKIDDQTAKATRGKYARICLEIDLKKPLAPFVWIDNLCQPVEYEGLHSICFKCGMYGHGEEQCQPHSDDVNVANQQLGKEKEKASEETPFGPWMIASRRIAKRGIRSAQNAGGLFMERGETGVGFGVS